ncbi:transcriptional regulator, DeoR family [Amphibacillus marinus]|uniref:Lactose phosphotransferase system repressor n=1 Tax=Amphibacillus marinus TaxID=872970 RepID=A0A1H8T8C6_9BACI|nr:DeoR/GlpR family DNA-binding transcription regulator [Amphibacillus marinus]SEO86733.1 transcriptional regulator, DeoR family [Amphibacillus marinus]
MLKRERQKKILQILTVENRVIAKELSQRLDVSEDTVRRDLREMDQKGQLKRVHSGAISNGPAVTNFEQRQQIDTELKNQLALGALPLFRENSVILVDGSTSNLRLVEALSPDFKATIITNSPFIAIALMQKKNIETILLGGTFAKRAAVSLGFEAMQELTKIKVDTYLMGVYNFDPTVGITVHNQLEAQMKRKMAEVSDEVIGIATADKLGVHDNYICIETDQVDYLITNAVDEVLLQEFVKRGVSIINA